MSEVTFGPGAVPVEQVAPPTTPATTAVATTPAAGTRAVAPGGPVLGDYIPTFRDIILPHILIVQNMSELGRRFPLGTLLFDGKLPLFNPPRIDPATGVVQPASPPVIITVLGWKDTRYVQKIEGSAARGMIVNSEAEVVSAGGTCDWSEWQLKKAAGMLYFQPLATALTLIRRPDVVADDGTIFTFDVDGFKYALAWWNMKGAIYTEGARKVFFTHRQTGCLRLGGYPSYNYATTTKLQKYNGGKEAWVPVCLPFQKSTESFLEFAKTVLKPQQALAN
jgi:hypothetical protein